MKRVYYAVLGSLLLFGCAAPKQEPPKRDADPTIAAIQDAISKDTTNWQLSLNLASELRRKNRYPEAQKAATKAFMLEPSPSVTSKLEMAKIHAAADEPASAINLVKEVEGKKKLGEAADEVEIAEVYAILGDTVAVFRWLDRAVKAHSPQLATLKDNPDLLGVHNDPRWPGIVGSKN
jgi:hypothetical protein